MSNMLIHLNDLALDDEVTLFQISGYDPDSPNDLYCFSNTLNARFNSIVYSPIACEIDGLEYRNEGSDPEPSVTVADPLNVIGSFEDTIEGATLKVIVTHKRFLDDQDTPDPTAIKFEEEFVIQNINSYSPGESIEFSLTYLTSYYDESIGMLALRKCPYIYRDPNTCKYTGAKYFNYNNQKVLKTSQDRCAQNVAACKLRGNLQNFGGAPTLGRN